MADNWSMLPNDLLDAIALKLDSIEDLVYFSAVCRSWNNVFIMVKQKWMSTTPWLLLAEHEHKHEHDVCSGRRLIFDIGMNKCLELNIPQASRRRCWGSSYGWIVMIGGHNDEQVSLFNPITKAQLSLPSLESLPVLPFNTILSKWSQPRSRINPSGWTVISSPIEPEDFEVIRVHKAFVLNIGDDDDDDFVVMVIYYHRILHDIYMLSLARPGDKAWTEVISTSREELPYVTDVMSWKGLVLILHRNGYLTYCDLRTIGNKYNPCLIVYDKPYNSIHSPRFNGVTLSYVEECYMVELDGDLLVVIRYKVDDFMDRFYSDHEIHDEYETTYYYTRDFKVYKLDHSGNENCCWTNVEDLGDYMVFVGNNSATSVHKSKIPNCQHNAIYFSDDCKEYWLDMIMDGYYDLDTIPRGKDMGVFDMTSRKVKRFYHGNNAMSKIFTPIWFTPKF